MDVTTDLIDIDAIHARNVAQATKLTGIPAKIWWVFIAGFDCVSEERTEYSGVFLLGYELHKWVLESGLPHECEVSLAEYLLDTIQQEAISESR